MGKDGGYLTPKAIGNRIKAKGLQKLRWYCQMCNKQCRDENGFKCHTQSESHQRQLLLAGESPHKFINNFSHEFHSGFFSTLRRTFGTKRILANTVYNEYIKDRDHIHMNSTRWVALAGYVQWLGKEGLCTIDQTEKGWYVTLIDKDPETVRRQMEAERKDRMELDDEQRQAKLIAEQIERANQKARESSKPVFTELVRKDEEEKIQVTFTKNIIPEKAKPLAPSLLVTASRKRSATTTEEEKPTEENGAVAKKSRWEESEQTTTKPSPSQAVFKAPFPVATSKPKKTALEEVREMEEKLKEQKNRKDYWLQENIVVKVITSKLGEKYKQKKGVVVKVENRYQAVVLMNDTHDKIRVDQAHVETVIPAVGKKVLVVNGAYRGQEAMLEELHVDKYCVDVTLLTGSMTGTRLDNVPYEDVSKLSSTDSGS